MMKRKDCNCNDCQLSNADDLCDKGHIERQPGNARFASQCSDFKPLMEGKAAALIPTWLQEFEKEAGY